MRRSLLSVVVCAALLGVLLPASAPASSLPQPLLGKVADRARDCVGDTFLDGDRPRAIDFVVWCGTQSGKVRFVLQRQEHGRIADFSRRLKSTGGKAAGFRCHRRGETIKCVGRKRGPATIRGWISVPRGTRCTASTRLETAEAIGVGAALGCHTL